MAVAHTKRAHTNIACHLCQKPTAGAISRVQRRYGQHCCEGHGCLAVLSCESTTAWGGGSSVHPLQIAPQVDNSRLCLPLQKCCDELNWMSCEHHFRSQQKLIIPVHSQFHRSGTQSQTRCLVNVLSRSHWEFTIRGAPTTAKVVRRDKLGIL